MKLLNCPTCQRVYNTTRDGGTTKGCAKCLARARRGGLKRDPAHVRRANVMQVWFSEDEWAALVRQHPDAYERARWVRDLIRAELEARDVLARMKR